MAFSNDTGVGSGPKITHFVKFKNGQFIVSERRTAPNGESQYIQLEPYRKITNILISRIALAEDEYEGRKYKVLRIIGRIDPGTIEEIVFLFKTALRTMVAGDFISRLKQADLHAPMDWVGAFERAGSQYKRPDGSMSDPLKRDISRILIYQNDRIVRRDISDSIPPVEERIVDGERTLLYGKRLAWAEEQVKILIDKLERKSKATQHTDIDQTVEFDNNDTHTQSYQPPRQPKNDDSVDMINDDDIPF